MKVTKKRLEEILLEEVKVFVQEKKLEEKTQMAAKPGSLSHSATVHAHISGLAPDAQPAALKFALKKGYKPGDGQIGYGTAPASETEDTWSWDKHEKSAGEKSSWFGELFGALSETNESLEQRKAEFAEQARAQAAMVDEACGDVEHEHGAIKIKIKKGDKNV